MIKNLFEQQADIIKELEQRVAELKIKNEDLRAGQLSLLKHIDRLKSEKLTEEDSFDDHNYGTNTETITTVDNSMSLSAISRDFLMNDVIKFGVPHYADNFSRKDRTQAAIALAEEFIKQINEKSEE